MTPSVAVQAEVKSGSSQGVWVENGRGCNKSAKRSRRGVWMPQSRKMQAQPTKSLWTRLGYQGGSFQGGRGLAALEAYSRDAAWDPEPVVGQSPRPPAGWVLLSTPRRSCTTLPEHHHPKRTLWHGQLSTRGPYVSDFVSLWVCAFPWMDTPFPCAAVGYFK